MNDGSIYDADYFIRGKASGKSLYENYHWMPDLTIPMVGHIIEHLGIVRPDTIVDYGCARGYIVRAFRELGHYAYGVDISKWAIQNCDKAVKDFVGGWEVTPENIDWIIAKDVLEHVESLQDTINELMYIAKKGVFVVVPLSSIDGEPYIVPEYEKDVTHIHRLSLASWARMFMRPGWRVEAMHRLKGVKDNYKMWENGNGFITARRITDE